jgi:outer membrane protein
MPRNCRFALSTLVAASLLGAAGPALATDLLQAWQAARSNDDTFAAALAALRASREKVSQGQAVLAAQVALTGNAGQTIENRRYGRPDSNQPGVYSGQTYGVGVGLSKPIFDAAGSATRDRLLREADQGEVQFVQAGQDLILRVAKAYFDVELARENLTLADAQKQAISEQLGLAKQSYELGIAPVTDMNDAQSRYDNVVAAEIAGQVDLEVKSDAFRGLTGLAPETLAPVSPTLEAEIPEPGALDRWLADTQAGNTTLRSLALGVEIARRTIDQYRLANSPVVSLTASYGRTYTAGSISDSGGRDAVTSGLVGIQLSIPLSDGGARRSLMRQAIATEDQQRAMLEAARGDAENATRQYFAGIRQGAQRIKALERAALSGAASLASSKLGREVGVRTAIDVLNAQQLYYQTLYTLVAARYDFLFDRLQLAASAGRLDEAALATVNASMKPTPGSRP